jgi:hypothetical protein
MDRLGEWLGSSVVEPFRRMTAADFDTYLNLRSPAAVEWRARLMGFGGSVIALPWAAVGIPIASRIGVSPEVAWGFAAFALGFSAMSWFAAPHLSHWAVDLLMDLVAAVAMVLIADVIDDLAGFLGVIWIGFGASIAIGRGLDAIGWLHIAWIGATSYGGLVVGRHDTTVSLLGWIATVGAVLVVTITIDRLTAQTRALAVAEPLARRA